MTLGHYITQKLKWSAITEFENRQTRCETQWLGRGVDGLDE